MRTCTTVLLTERNEDIEAFFKKGKITIKDCQRIHSIVDQSEMTHVGSDVCLTQHSQLKRIKCIAQVTTSKTLIELKAITVSTLFWRQAAELVLHLIKKKNRGRRSFIFPHLSWRHKLKTWGKCNFITYHFPTKAGCGRELLFPFQLLIHQ